MISASGEKREVRDRVCRRKLVTAGAVSPKPVTGVF